MHLLVALSLVCLTLGSSDGAIKIVRMPPYFTEEPPATVNILSSQPITLPCVAEGSPQPDYTWYKNGEPLKYTAHVLLETGTGMLTFSIPTILDQGYYQCVASNQYGKAMSSVSYLQNIFLAGFQDVTSVESRTVKAGDSVIFECNPPKSVPPPIIQWGLKNKVTEATRMITLDRRMQIAENGNLMFANVVESDQQDGFDYFCQVENNVMISTSGGSKKSLTVQPNPGASNRAPTIMHMTTSPVIALTGEDTFLQCLFSGLPTPQVSWNKLRGSMPSNGRATQEVYGTKLRISSVEKADEGTYVCSAVNSVGPSQRQEIQVTVHSRPTFKPEGSPVNVNGTVDDEQIIRCDANSIPESNVLWYINGEPVNVDRPPYRMVFDDNNRVLKIRKLCKDCTDGERPTDLMVIQCNASNQHGYAFGQGYLNVLNRTEIFEIPPKNRIVSLDEKELSLPCQARTDSQTDLTIMWYKGKDPISSIGDPNLVVEPNNLLYVNMHEMDENERWNYQDTYKCVATNGYSSDEAISDVEIEGKPAPVVQSAGFTWWWIIVLIAILLLLLILLLCCCLCAQRNKGDDYDVEKMEKKNGNNPEKELKDNSYKEYQRPESQPMKGSRASLASSVPLDSDDDNMADEYGDIDPGRFNEDGSFLGAYTGKNKHSHV